jgi:hypothetical protein
MNKNSGENKTRIKINVRVIPRAKKNEISGLMEDGVLKVRLTAPPVDGKANQALVKLLAKAFNVSASQISITSGAHSRNKSVYIDGLTSQKYQAFIDRLNR